MPNPASISSPEGHANANIIVRSASPCLREIGFLGNRLNGIANRQLASNRRIGVEGVRAKVLGLGLSDIIELFQSQGDMHG